MYSFRIFFSLLFATLTVVSGDVVKEEKKNLGLQMFMRLGVNGESCDPEETTCADDKLTFCPFGNGKITISCSSVFGNNTGYCDCDGVQCTRLRPVCVQPDDEKCKKIGKMPDPSNCKKFTYCNGQIKKSYSCPDGMSYDPNSQSCKPENICRTIVCNTKNILEYVPFPQAPQYYLFCYMGIGEVRECSQPGYSMQDGKCQFQCKESGLFVDPKPENCRKGIWHSCILSRNKLLIRQTNYCGMDGENQLYFNEEIGICQPQDICGSSTPKPTNPSIVQ